MPAKKKKKNPQNMTSKEQVKEVCRLIRLARSRWDAHNNAACRAQRKKAINLYNQLDTLQKKTIPQVLRVWLRYRSAKYFDR